MDNINRVIAGILCNNCDNVREIAKQIDWNIFDQKVKALSLGANIYYNSRNSSVIPDNLIQDYKKIFDKSKVLNTIQYNYLKELLVALHSAKIEVIVFKGAYLLEKYYKQFGLRTMGDVDILIKKDKLAEVERIVRKLGFKYKEENCPKEWFDKNYYRSSLYTKGPFELEIHWNLLPNANPLDFSIEDVWSRSKAGVMCEVPVLEMPIEILVIYLAFHISYCHFFNQNSIKRLYDIHKIITQTQLDWEYLILKSKEYNVNNFVGIVLRYLKDIFQTNINDINIDRLITSQKVKMFKQIISVDVLFDAISESNPNKTMFSQRLIQLTGINNVNRYIKLICTKKEASAKWIAALYNVNPNSVKVLIYNWFYFIIVVPNYILHKVRCL